MPRRPATVGVSDHAGWAIFMTVAHDGTLIDRRRVELLEAGLPALPHHHEAQGLPPEEGVALVEQVRASAERRAREGLEALAATVSLKVAAIALRRWPSLPPTVAERIASYRAQCVADSVMYRQALADAASARGWTVCTFDPRTVFGEAATALGLETVDGLLAETGRSAGRPWRQDHRLAMAAAIVAGRGRARARR